ncbi:MAG: hypothetical protein ACTS5I_13200, partial [Rhodanobacter sp.]
ALGRGGFERLNAADYGRIERQLRDSYARMTRLVRDIEAGRVTIPQALNRISGYTLEARRHYFVAQRDAVLASGRTFEERRTLHARESCSGCINLARRGWQPAGILPLPADGSTPCGSFCRCTMETREVTQEMAQERRERVTA